MKVGNATHSVNGASTTKEGGLWGKFADFIWVHVNWLVCFDAYRFVFLEGLCRLLDFPA